MDMSIEQLARTVRVYDLGQDHFEGMPSYSTTTPNYQFGLHRRHEYGTGEVRTNSAGLFVSTEHQGTHVDALCHVAEDMVLYGDVKIDLNVQTAKGFTHLGAETIPPLVGRGILLDVAGHMGVDRIDPGFSIPLEMLQDVCSEQNVEPKPGDVVLVRTGYGAEWRSTDLYNSAGGVGIEGCRWLAEIGVSAVGGDNVGFEVTGVIDPELCVTLPGHIVLISRSGIYILENLNLETLAQDSVVEFLFAGLPLKMVGATGAPLRPAALVWPKLP